MNCCHLARAAMLAGLASVALAAAAGSARANQLTALRSSTFDLMTPDNLLTPPDIDRPAIIDGVLETTGAFWKIPHQDTLFNLHPGTREAWALAADANPAISSGYIDGSASANGFAGNGELHDGDLYDGTTPAIPGIPAAPTWAMIPIGFWLVGYAHRKRNSDASRLGI